MCKGKWPPAQHTEDADGNDTGESAYYLSSNRNKRSVAIDVANPEGAALVRRLAAKCDIFVENFKVGGLAKYGLAYDDLKADLPGLVYCSITGFGQTGPNRMRAGYDYLAQGMGGIMSITGLPFSIRHWPPTNGVFETFGTGPVRKLSGPTTEA